MARTMMIRWCAFVALLTSLLSCADVRVASDASEADAGVAHATAHEADGGLPAGGKIGSAYQGWLLPSNTLIKATNNSGAGTINVAGTDGSNDVIIGDNTNATATQIYSSSLTSLTASSSSLALISGVVSLGTAQNLHWGTQSDAPLLDQAQQANGSNPNSMTFSAQTPGAGAASTATGTPGGYVFNLAVPVSTGATAQLRVVDLQSNHGNVFLGPQSNGNTGYGCEWLGTVSPTGSNYSICGNGSSSVNIGPPLVVGGSVTLDSGALTYALGATSPTISQSQQSNGSNPNNLTISPQPPGAGAASTATGTPGSLVVNVAAPVSTGNEAGLILERGGTPIAMLSRYAPGQAYATLWLGSTPAGAPSTSNYAVTGDNSGVNTYVNGPTNLNFAIAGSVTGVWAASGLQLFNTAGSFGGGSGVLGITNATTDPTSNPSGGGVLYEANGVGSLRHRGPGGALVQLAGAGGGTVNTQKMIVQDKEVWVVRTTSTTATTVFTSGSVTASHITSITANCQSIDTTALAASSAAAGIACSFVNNAGTLAQLGTTTTIYNHNYTAAPVCTISGTTVLVQVSAKTTDTTDTQCVVNAIQD